MNVERNQHLSVQSERGLEAAVLAGGCFRAGCDLLRGSDAGRVESKIHMPSRRQFLLVTGIALGWSPALGCLGSPGVMENQMTTDTQFPVQKTDAEWRDTLSPEQYTVLREHGTERAFTSPLNNEKRPGTFVCAGCRQRLFSSDTKYRQRHRMAEFLQAARGRRRHQHRSELLRGAHRSALCALRRTPGARVPRWSASHRRALLHERSGDEVRAEAMRGNQQIGLRRWQERRDVKQ